MQYPVCFAAGILELKSKNCTRHDSFPPKKQGGVEKNLDDTNNDLNY
jgi:hypothetical protein